MVITAAETAAGVSFTGSGSFNLAALTNLGPGCSGYSVFGGVGSLTDGSLVLGKSGDPFTSLPFDCYSGITSQPAAGSFGSISTSTGPQLFLLPSAGSGPLFGFGTGTGPVLVVPEGYQSGAPLSAFSEYDYTSSPTPIALTFANLGLTAGTYTWSWGSGSTADSLVLQVGNGGSASVPAPLPLLGGGAAFAWTRRIRRRLGRLGRSHSGG